MRIACRRIFLGVVVLGFLVLCLGVVPSQAQSSPSEQKEKDIECTGPWTNKEIDEKTLAGILKAHQKWLETNEEEGKRANLCGATLHEAQLQKANLRFAQLQGAGLGGAQLQGADLNYAQLQKAFLPEAQLQKTKLRGAQLEAAFLEKAQLRGANLFEAQLERAELEQAQLQGANLLRGQLEGANLLKAQLQGAELEQAQLQNANLRFADLQGADLEYAQLQRADLYRIKLNEKTDLSKIEVRDTIFEPTIDSHIPEVPILLTWKDIHKIRFSESPHALVQIREKFKKAGLRDKEREITYAIKRSERINLMVKEDSTIFDKMESVFLLVMFEWTCEYGMSPGKPLRILFFIFILSPILYLYVMLDRQSNAVIEAYIPQSGMPIISKGGRKRVDQGIEIKERVNKEFFFPKTRNGLEKIENQNLKKLLTRLLNGLSLLVGSYYFSLLSTFRLGWRDLNVGTWISRIQPRDYTLRATGWVKFYSGLQSLVCVYLLALWALTYFGRPFE